MLFSVKIMQAKAMKNRKDKSDFSNRKAKCLFYLILAKEFSILDWNLNICL
ncbi:MAG: hypothetical protein P857_665 [Candidatus Xenolissoclinum pacificiensis L6]|uniref:Uncharacterized protein n=1 Tax=Candidatus Xenolissoclinum pacificiensis L6 TaxID=1401685 RepID=W2V0J5_9RICK|nr:MAG: hypothetical protein P857_665 [Candidatus Xenolissoclinum pacificiensis L6]